MFYMILNSFLKDQFLKKVVAMIWTDFPFPKKIEFFIQFLQYQQVFQRGYSKSNLGIPMLGNRLVYVCSM